LLSSEEVFLKRVEFAVVVSDIIQAPEDESLAMGEGITDIDVLAGSEKQLRAQGHCRVAITHDALPYLARQLSWFGTTTSIVLFIGGCVWMSDGSDAQTLNTQETQAIYPSSVF
jgi:hypothetical protein